VFGIGDCTNAPTAKTAAAVGKSDIWHSGFFLRCFGNGVGGVTIDLGWREDIACLHCQWLTRCLPQCAPTAMTKAAVGNSHT
jgi:hypothetical protein